MKIFRWVFSALLLSLIVHFVGIGEFIDAFRNIHLGYVCCLLLLSVVMIWVSSLKWQLFVRAMGYEESILELMRLYTLSYFFNTFMPGTVGGDVVRSFHLGRKMDSQGSAFVATFLERFTGLLAMSIMGVVFVLFGSGVTSGLETAIFLVGFASAVLALICFSSVLNRLSFNLLLRIASSTIPNRYLGKINLGFERLSRSMAVARADKLLLLKGLGWSFVFHALTVVNTYVAALAIGWENPSFTGLFVVVPLVLLISMAPITPNGVGVQEGAFVFLLKRIGASPAQGLAVAVLLRAKVLVIGIVGWLIWMTMEKGSTVRTLTPAEDRLENVSN